MLMGCFLCLAFLLVMMITDNPFVVMMGYGSLGNQDCGSKAQDQYGQPAVHERAKIKKTC